MSIGCVILPGEQVHSVLLKSQSVLAGLQGKLSLQVGR